MTNTTLSEAEMRQALGLDAAFIIPTTKSVKPTPLSNYTLVELSVRHNGSLPFRFEYRSRSISTLAAQLEAEKAARDQGYEVWVLLGIEQVSQ
ncbi:hypothetical protein [Pseudomonas putida]|uniref:hypothetical protein n=1 Tax=Pseudomonas putida TaxID=303 RepID=UPI001E29855B|nr:hypothetical protein [Pseudomonas putida]MCE0963389.1 hypothetical protein [Pseudomonas putida]